MIPGRVMVDEVAIDPGTGPREEGGAGHQGFPWKPMVLVDGAVAGQPEFPGEIHLPGSHHVAPVALALLDHPVGMAAGSEGHHDQERILGDLGEPGRGAPAQERRPVGFRGRGAGGHDHETGGKEIDGFFHG